MATGFTLKITREGVVGKERFGTLDAALDALEQEARAFANTERRDSAAGIMRTYEPDEIVALRAEVAGRRVRAGVDVRGDGSAEAFTGRLRRTLISQEPGESPYGALRRVLGASAPSGVHGEISPLVVAVDVGEARLAEPAELGLEVDETVVAGSLVHLGEILGRGPRASHAT